MSNMLMLGNAETFEMVEAADPSFMLTSIFMVTLGCPPSV